MPLITRAFPDNFTTSQVKGWEILRIKASDIFVVCFFSFQTPKNVRLSFFLLGFCLNQRTLLKSEIHASVSHVSSFFGASPQTRDSFVPFCCCTSCLTLVFHLLKNVTR